MKQQNFLKNIATTPEGTSISHTVDAIEKNTYANINKKDFGEVKSIKIECISETGWFDNAILGKDVKDAGGINTSQYDIIYTESNLGGYSALIEVEGLDGKKNNYLLDSGWSVDWMDYVFAKSGVDRMLSNREIKTMVISHDHNDHFFGIESSLKHQPDIKMYFPSTSMKKSFELLKGADFSEIPGCPKNEYPHTGELIITKPDKLYKLQDGAAVVSFDVTAGLQVRGENVMYFKIKDKGYVIVTGCCHPGILPLLNYARCNFRDGSNMYGCYGGLHISPFEMWDSEKDNIIAEIQQCNMKKIACNHCTGRIWAEKALRAGLPIVPGTDKFRSYKKVSTLTKGNNSNIYTSNGDIVKF